MPETPPEPGHRQASDRPVEESGTPYHLLFVCTGNTCRSPLALGLAERTLEDWGWQDVKVQSAGVAAFSGSLASWGALRAAERHGIDLTAHRSSQLTAPLVRWADLILTMSAEHLAAVDALGGAGRAALITAFGLSADESLEVSEEGVLDPMGGDDAVYEETFEQLRVLVEAALTRVAKERK